MAWRFCTLPHRGARDVLFGRGLEHRLAIEGGSLPKLFAKIRNAAMARSPDDPQCDFIFDVPIDVAKTVVGFRHDDVEVEFEELRKSKKWK
jgi:hypothetical protein